MRSRDQPPADFSVEAKEHENVNAGESGSCWTGVGSVLGVVGGGRRWRFNPGHVSGARVAMRHPGHVLPAPLKKVTGVGVGLGGGWGADWGAIGVRMRRV